MTENFHAFHFICVPISHLTGKFQEHTTNVITNYKKLKRVVIVLEILFIAIAVQICISVMPYTQAEIDALSIAPPFTKYENPAFGIKFVYPSNWDLTENLTHVSVAVHPKNESDYSEMEVVVKDLSKNVTVDKYTDTVMRELKKKISNFTATTAQLTSLYGNMGNEYAKNFTFSGLYRQKPVQGLTVYTLNDNKAYILTFISQDPHFKLASEAEILIHSFEFYRNLKYSDVTIERHNSFDHGLLEFYTKFDNSYGGIGSSRIRLVVNDSNNAFFWVIFHNSSIYYPNSYRMAQNTNDTWTNKHNSLNQTIEYGKWYHVGLLFNDTDVSFYFNDALVETFKRPSNDSYTYLQLVTESAAVSFANVREITSSGTSELLIPMTSWYGTQGTFMAKKIDVSPIFTLVPIYPPLGYQSIHPPLNDTNLAADKIVTGLNFPTGMAFLGPNDILVIEKNQGTVRRIVNGTMLPEPLLDVNVANKNERGMLGIATATRDFSNQSEKEDMKGISDDSRFVFLYYTESNDNDGDDVTRAKEPLGNRLYRYEFVNDKLVNPKLLLDLPTSSSIHNGGKIVIGPDHNVYLAVGNLDQNDSKAQNDLTGRKPDGAGGVLYITPDGKAVKNILGKEDYLANYYSYGIRNSFGIGFDPLSGILWDTENGPAYEDEINLVRAGFNSGWKEIQGLWKDEDDTSGNVLTDMKDLVEFNGNGKYSDPEFVWHEAVGLTDLIFLNSSKLGKNYENDMFVGDFHYGYLYHFKLNNDRTELLLKEPLADKLANTYEELENVIFGEGFGGITDLEVGPDGYIYVLAVNFGGGDCDPDYISENCIPYNGKNIGSIFRIAPVKSHP